jgi:predicted secreted protein
MKRIAALLLCGAFLFALQGCQRERVYNGNDPDNRSIVLGPGQTFVVRLDENPTTGCRWEFSIADAAVVAAAGDEYVPDDKTGKLAGSGGTRKLAFKTLAPGRTTITAVYRRPFETAEPIKTVIFAVIVTS